MARLLFVFAATAVLSQAIPAQSVEDGRHEPIVNFMSNHKRANGDGVAPGRDIRGGKTIQEDGSVEQEFKNFVALPGTNFGERAGFQSVVSGDSSTVAIGSPFADTYNGERSGSVSVYKRVGVVWTLMGEPIVGDTAMEQSGYSIALNFAGDTIAIGSPYFNRTNPDDNYDQTVPYVGQVRVFTFEGSWSQLGVAIQGTQSGAKCGFSVHLGGMGRNLVLGCPLAKDYAHVRPNSGLVKVMKYDEDELKWASKGSPIYGLFPNICAGVRVSMSGDANTMAFIAPGRIDSDPTPGRVRVFTYAGEDWEQLGEPIINFDPNDMRGRAMAMSRDGLTIAIGSPKKSGGGHVRVYTWEDPAWVQKGQTVEGGGGSYHSVGTSVALNTDGSILALGAPHNAIKGDSAGRVSVYYWNEERTKGGTNLSPGGMPVPGWALKGQKLDGDEGDTNGFSVHLTGKGHMITMGSPQYKHKRDKDHLLFNAAVEPPLNEDDEELYGADHEEDEDEDDKVHDEEAPLHRLVVRDTALSDVPIGRLDAAAGLPFSSGGDASGKQKAKGDHLQKHGAAFGKTKGNGRARVMGAFKCNFLGDITPPDNPY
jgi:hypothetical protein